MAAVEMKVSEAELPEKVCSKAERGNKRIIKFHKNKLLNEIIMEKVIVMSDTHGNQKYLRRVLEQENSYDYIFHLGDFYEDMDENPDLFENAILKRVPGIFNKRYLSGSLPKTELVEILNWKFLLVHFINDAIKLKNKTDIILFGHTHNPYYSKEEETHLINPGHLKQAHHRDSDASYLVMEVESDKIKLIYKTLMGKEQKIITIEK